MHLAIEESSNVSIKGVEILAPHDSPNTDGIHLHMSNNVSIEKCIIGTGDDCISIAKNTSNVVIREIICGPGHGISIGSLGRNKTPEFVSNVKVENSILESTKYGLRIKTWQGGQGFASNFSYYNVVMMNVLQPIIIDQYYCDGNSSFSCGTEELDAVKVSNVSYSNIMGTSASSVALRFQCSLGNPCYNLVLENVFLNLSNGSTPSAFCLNAFGQNKGLRSELRDKKTMVAVNVDRYVDLQRMINDMVADQGSNATKSIRVKQYDSFDYPDYDHWVATNNKRALKPDCHFIEDEVALDPPHADRITRAVSLALQQEEEDNRKQLEKEVNCYTRQWVLQHQSKKPRH
ncbi:probable polygalacturonase At1g80170 [Selaginella moellendorffii]|uniref:probable polygalacturonase At1g80170 n=1 Tax=Selaginella moellendorffii TaxID=88036 RepID=UPI000D1D0AEB|nr:probable polygalacturonase At1g80170 [Selaginella moellendorffii]|eukprot:XP_024515048.1 probable polygalacturonase At1g80170 [Selaginella moellendorffii]